MAIFLHDRADFRDLISVLSSQLGIAPQLVEKDYWIMHALWGLNHLGLDFELKGGTSLSKGWKCIDRFSEDIDIHLIPPAHLNLPVKKTQLKPNQILERRKFFDSLVEKIKIPGFTSVLRDTAFDDEKMRNAGLRLICTGHFGSIEGLKDGILLEVGFDQTTPNEEVNISSWMLEKALEAKLDVMDNTAVRVKCYIPEYTFVEKLQTISTKFRKEQEDGQKPANFMRHYYDISQLLKMERVQKFIGCEEYHKHKEARFRSGDEKDISKNQAFILSNEETRKKYQDAFEKTRGLYYKEFPSLDEILEGLRVYLEKM